MMPSHLGATPHRRTVGIDLAISAAQVAQVFDDGRPIGKPMRFRLTPTDLKRFVAAVKKGVDDDTPITAVMEPTGMAWFPVASCLHALPFDANYRHASAMQP